MFKAIIVEDEPLVKEAIKLQGEWESYNIKLVNEFTNGKFALDYIKQNDIDIVITDMNMPFMNGVELLQEVDKMDKNIKIIIISAYNDFEYMRQAIYSKVIDYLLKPIDDQNLNDALSIAITELQDELSIDLEYYELNIMTIEKIEKYLRQNYKTDVSLAKLSEEFFLSKEYISRSFKKRYGITMVDYIAKLRIERAKRYLSDLAICVEEIAFNVGYNSGNYFTKIFKKYEGLSPTEYRKKRGR